MNGIPQLDVNDIYKLNLRDLSDIDILTEEYKEALDKLVDDSIKEENMKEHFWKRETPHKIINKDFFEEIHSKCIKYATRFPIDELTDLKDSSKGEYDKGIQKKITQALNGISLACDAYFKATPRRIKYATQSEANGNEKIPVYNSESALLGIVSHSVGVSSFNHTYEENSHTISEEFDAVSDLFDDDTIESLIKGIYDKVEEYNSALRDYSEPISELGTNDLKIPVTEMTITIINSCLNKLSEKPYSKDTDQYVAILQTNIDSLNENSTVPREGRINAGRFISKIMTEGEKYIIERIKEKGFEIKTEKYSDKPYAIKKI